jgi:hypothetical protein
VNFQPPEEDDPRDDDQRQQEAGAMNTQDLIAALTGAANYIDTLGGNSQIYRVTLAAAIRADERGSAEPVSDGELEELRTKARDYDRIAGIARNRRHVLEEIAGLMNRTATEAQFSRHLQRLAQKACDDFTFAGDDTAPARAGSEPGLREAVFTVLDCFTLSPAVRKMLEAAYYATPEQPAQAQPAVEGLTDEQCNEFRRMPCSFNDMVRAIYNAGALTAAPKADPEAIERNFCTRCGKRLVAGDVHTCTPPLMGSEHA